MLAAKEFVRSTLATHEKTRRLAELATDTLVEVVDACADRGVPLAGYAKGVTGFFKKEADDVLQAPYAHLKNDAGENAALIRRLREQLRAVEQELFETRARAHVREQQLRDEEARCVELELALNEARARGIEQVPALDPDSPTRYTHSHSLSENEPHTPGLQHAASTMTFGVPDADSPPPLELRGEDADEFLKAIGMDPDDADIFNKLRALDYSSDDDVPPELVRAVYDPGATAVAPATPVQPPQLSRTDSSPLGIPHSGTFGLPGSTPESGRFNWSPAPADDGTRTSVSAGIPESGTFGFPESSAVGPGATSSAVTPPAGEDGRAAVSSSSPAQPASSTMRSPEEPPTLTPALVHNPFGHSFASLPAAVEMLQLDRAPAVPGPSAADVEDVNLAATLDPPRAVSADDGLDAQSTLPADESGTPDHGTALVLQSAGRGVSEFALDSASGSSVGPSSAGSTAPKLRLVPAADSHGSSLHDSHSGSGPRASPSGVAHAVNLDADPHAEGQNPWAAAEPAHKPSHQHKPSAMTGTTADDADTFASVMPVPPASVHTYPPSRAASIAESQSFAARDSSGGHSFAANGIVHLNDSSGGHATPGHAVRFPIENSSKEDGVALPLPGRARAKSVGGGHKGRLAHMFEALERRLSIGRDRADSSSASEASVKHATHKLHKPRSRANSAGTTALSSRSPATERTAANAGEMGELSGPTGAASETRRTKSPRISIVSRFSSLRDVKTRGT
ncbi:hypothetical protein AURDEDRAFT_187585 [Auricularia subglabra TFB-10046 SS5]|nr:hypothetical protein AURDEDRAFT_187585 [Auricularia subglabra TFB-10046 SS5]